MVCCIVDAIISDYHCSDLIASYEILPTPFDHARAALRAS
jgi:hypothetical protein